MSGDFDAAAAKAAGYSDDEIQQYLVNRGAALNAAAPRGVQHGGAYFQDPTTPEWQEKWGPLSGLSDWERTEVGFGRGVESVGRNIGNLAGLVPNSTLEEYRTLDAPLLADPNGRLGNLLGEAAVTTPFAMGAGALAGRAIPALAESLTAQGGIQGLTQGLATAEPGNRVRDALVGALTGGTGGALSRVAKTAAMGVERTPAADRLLRQGIDLTPGQMNPTGAMNQFEQASESIPGAKQLVESSRDAAEHGWQRAVLQEGAAPGTQIKPSSDQYDMLQQAYDSYKPLYSQARGYPVNMTVSRIPLSTVFDRAAATPGTTKDAQDAARSWLQNELTRLPVNPTSDDLLELRSNIRQVMRTARLSSDTIAQDKAAIFANAEAAVTRSLNEQLPSSALQALQTADRQYGKYKVVENAVAASKDNLAGLTPTKLSQAIYNATPDQSYALGAGGSLRQLARDGAEVFQNVSPPTGARVATLGTALGLGAAAIHSPVLAVPVIGGATGALGAVATPLGRRIAQGATAPQRAVQELSGALSSNVPQPLRNVMRAYGTQAAIGAGNPYTLQYSPAVAAALASSLLHRGGTPAPEPGPYSVR